MKAPHALPLRWAAVLSLLALSGCATPLEPTSGEPAASGSHATPAPAGIPTAGYPLRPGTQWVYEGEIRTTLIEDGTVVSTTVTPTRAVHGIICSEDHGGTPYAVEEQANLSRGLVSSNWFRYRQDLNGLYELDVSINDPPVCMNGAARPPTLRAIQDPAPRDPVPASLSPSKQAAYRDAIARLKEKVDAVHALLRPDATTALSLPGPGGVREGELTRLRYPLRAKSRWVFRNKPFLITSEVEGVDALSLPAGRMTGYRIRLRGPLLDEYGSIRLWYGSAGYLQMVTRFSGFAAFDSSGNFVGTVEQVELEQLVEMRPPSTRPPLP